MHSAQELVSQIKALASLPTVYHRISEQLDSPDGSIVEVVKLVAADPALTTGVLRLVNSAFYGFSGKIDTLERAIPILGLQQIHDMVLAMSVSAVFDGVRPDDMDMKRFWHGSMMCALAARGLARASGHAAAERMFVIGLLADLGHLVMYQLVPELAERAQRRSQSKAEPLHLAERAEVGCDHAEIGAALMNGWGLPDCFAEIIGAQITPRLAGSLTLDASLLHIACQVAKADRFDEASSEVVARIEPSLWHNIGLEPTRFSAVREEAELQLAACIAAFFPRLR